MTLCDICHGELRVVNVYPDYDGDGKVDEIELEVCPKCKKFWIESSGEYTLGDSK